MANHFSLDLLLLTALAILNLLLISAANTPSPPTTTPSPASPPTSTTTAVSLPPPPPPLISPPQPPSSPTTKPPPSPRTTTLPITTTKPPPPPSSDFQEDTLDNIIDALLGQGGFAIWANLLSSAVTATTIPITATLFIPSNAAISHLPTATSAAINFDPFLIPYHITPHRLSFADLRLFKPQSRIPTLLPSKSILITNTSRSNFTLDNSLITHPNIYLSPAVAVHGIKHILDYTLYGDSFPAPPPAPPQPLVPTFFPGGEVLGSTKSDAATCLCTESTVIFSVLIAAFAFKISVMGLFSR